MRRARKSARPSCVTLPMSSRSTDRRYALHAPTLFGVLVAGLGLLLPLALLILAVATNEALPAPLLTTGLALGFVVGLALLISIARLAVQLHVSAAGIQIERFPMFSAGPPVAWERLTHIRVVELGLHEIARRSMVTACLAVLSGAGRSRVVLFGMPSGREQLTLTRLSLDDAWARIEWVAPLAELLRLRSAGARRDGAPTTL